MPTRADIIFAQLEELPPLPAVALRVLEATAREEVDTDEIVELIASDPGLATRVLQLVNHADRGARDVTDLKRAVVLVGLSAVRSAVIASGVVATLPPGEQCENEVGLPGRYELWLHSIAVATAAEALAERMPDAKERIEPAEAFCCGLLHDLGKLALQACLPKSYARIIKATAVIRGDISQIERQVIGLDHMTAGRRLACRWQLPPVIGLCAWLHNQHPEALPESVGQAGRMIHLVTLADQIARAGHLGYSGNYTFGVPRQLLLDELKLTAADCQVIGEGLIPRVQARALTLGVGNADAERLYRDALARANSEITQQQQQIEVRKSQHRKRAKFFATLSQFRRELRPDAGVREVLQAVAETAEATVDTGPVAVFSLPPHPGDDASAAVLICDRGRIVQRAEPRAHPLPPKAGDGPIEPAEESLEWLVSIMSPMLRGTHFWWVRLSDDEGCLGGLVWGGAEDEPARLADRLPELSAMAAGWAMTMRMGEMRDASAKLAEQLAEANRRLVEANEQMARDRTVLAVAELAAGAAHEMNNPLMVISGRSQLLYHRLKDPKDKRTAMLLHQNAQRLSEMITQLMRFAKPDPAQVVSMEAATLVDDALELLSRLPERDRARFELNLPETPMIEVDRVQIGRALAAVIENALQAVPPENGVIEIHAACDLPGEYLVLTVTDNGCGMDEQTLRHACDPFFSRKAAGRRRGMGLAVALRFVESHGGRLRLDSREGAGTRVIIMLPLRGSLSVADLAARKIA